MVDLAAEVRAHEVTIRAMRPDDKERLVESFCASPASDHSNTLLLPEKKP
jgi:hypothetical protein